MSWKKVEFKHRNITQDESVSKDIICQVNEELLDMKKAGNIICELRMSVFYTDDEEASRLESINQCKNLLIKIMTKYCVMPALDTVRRMELEREFTVIHSLFHEATEYSYSIDDVNRICDELDISYNVISVEYSPTPAWRVVRKIKEEKVNGVS